MTTENKSSDIIQFTVFQSSNPNRLSKAFRLDATGMLEKLSGGNMVSGEAFFQAVSSLNDLAAVLQSLTPSNAIAWGTDATAIGGKANVVTKDSLETLPKSTNGVRTIARDREHFAWSKGPAVMMLDYDAEESPLSPDELLQELYKVCPSLKNAPHLIRPSASSFIYQGKEELRGARGWRVLVVVSRGEDIPRAGENLFRRLWLAGHGRIEVSQSGALLLRSLIDASVWQPERLDFLGGADCQPPLSQRMPPAEIFNPAGAPIDTLAALPELTRDEEAKFKGLVDAAREAAKNEAGKRQKKFVEERIAEEMAKTPTSTPEETEGLRVALKERFKIAVEQGTLLGDFELLTGAGSVVTVGEVLDNPGKFHGVRFHDPLEPEYKDHRCAVANLHAMKPYIWSYAHGGRRFNLHQTRHTIEMVQGERAQIVRHILKLVRLDRQLYDHGGELARVSSAGEIIPLDLEGAIFYLDGLARWMKWNERAGVFRPSDCDKKYATGLLACKGDWGIPKLKGLATAPLLFPSGRMIESDGFDSETGLLLMLAGQEERWPGIPVHPTLGEAKAAVDFLWKPF